MNKIQINFLYDSFILHFTMLKEVIPMESRDLLILLTHFSLYNLFQINLKIKANRSDSSSSE